MFLSYSTMINVSDKAYEILKLVGYITRNIEILCDNEKFGKRRIDVKLVRDKVKEAKLLDDDYIQYLINYFASNHTFANDRNKHLLANIPIKCIFPKKYFGYNGFELIRIYLSKELGLKYGLKKSIINLKSNHYPKYGRIVMVNLYLLDNKQIKVKTIISYQEEPLKQDNKKYLSIDIGLHNLLTCYNNKSGNTFIIGREYLSICRKYDKIISEITSVCYKRQSEQGIKHPKFSKHLVRLYQKRKNVLNDYLQKVTAYVVKYCIDNDINTVVIGDLKGLSSKLNKGRRLNHQISGLPFDKIYFLLEFKLQKHGIRLVKVNEAFTSTTPLSSPSVSSMYAIKENRVKRGLYVDGKICYNADSLAAYNILRKYLGSNKLLKEPRVPIIIKI